MFSVISRSSRNGGSGMTIIATTSTTAAAATRSVWRWSLLQQVHAAALCSSGDLVDVGEELRDGREHLLGDHVADLDARVERSGQGRIRHDHDPVIGSSLPDP